MQIGNKELENIYINALVPAIKSNDLEAKRVDKHNSGGLLKSEIIEFINDAEIIVADITNERQNCYLEIGYAMGIGKFKNLILTVREDHFHDSPNYVKNGPKVHFDLGGYDILRWERNDINGFRVNLEKRIQRRLQIIGKEKTPDDSLFFNDWNNEHKENAKKGIAEVGMNGYNEIEFALNPPLQKWSPKQLMEASKFAQIHTFGWPIGINVSDNINYKPKPRADGIFAEINNKNHGSYDYWAINRNGSFYTLVSLFEEIRKPGFLFIEPRIYRATEALLFCARFYSKLGVDPLANISFEIGFEGLKERRLISSNMWRTTVQELISHENSMKVKISLKLEEVETKLSEKVNELLSPLFSLFDFYEIEDSAYEALVNKFVGGNL